MKILYLFNGKLTVSERNGLIKHDKADIIIRESIVFMEDGGGSWDNDSSLRQVVGVTAHGSGSDIEGAKKVFAFI